MIEIVRSKLHGLYVTGCDLEYHGSITLDPAICQKAGIYPMEFVYIWNRNSGQRISTYVIYGEPGSRCCILNGAAARTCQRGDCVIICSSEYVNGPQDLYSIKPNVLTFDTDNTIVEHFQYTVFESPEFTYDFRINAISA